MEALLELERLGYQFILNGSSVYYTHKGENPEPEKVGPLLDSLRRHRMATMSFLQQRASREAHDKALIEAEASALLERLDTMNELEWCRRWAEVMAKMSAPCTTHDSWAAWLAEMEAEAEEEHSAQPTSAII